MKNLIVLSFFLFVLQGCNKQDATPAPSNPNQVSGTWKITSLIDNKSRDRTSNYNSYTFEFLTTGVFNVKQGTAIIKSGTWSNTSSYWAAAIVIAIPGVLAEDDLGQLNEDWRIIEKNDTVIKVQNGGGKVLVFGK